jgi:4-amino-4-deoxy-L-arabinose transferase-like glycosyltransferase
MLMTQAIPLLSIFLFFSLFRETLPHWSAPAYYSLVLLASCALDAKLPVTFNRIPAVIKTALGITLVVIFAGTAEILTGFVALERTTAVTSWDGPILLWICTAGSNFPAGLGR